MRTTRLLVALTLGSTAWLGCNREPADITVDQARPIAEKEFSKWCNSEGFHCTDFKAKAAVAKPPPEDPLFEWNFQWVAEQAVRPSMMSVLVTKKGVPGVRLQALGPGDGSSPVAAAPATPVAAKPAAPPAAPVAVQAASSKTPATAKAPPAAATLAVVKTPAAEANPKAKDPAEKTPPPLPSSPPPPPARSAATRSLEPTFQEVFNACETEIGILCLSSPSSVPQARNCLRPHRAALRNSCGKVVGLKKGFDED